jgi:hypothetical protein
MSGIIFGGLVIPDSSITPAKLSQPLTLATAVNSTSGTSIDFTGIPSWVDKITIMLNRVSTNASSALLIQIGSGSITNTGYVSQRWTGASGSGVVTSGFDVGNTAGAANSLSGIVSLNLVSGNLWVSSSNLNYMNTTSSAWVSSGSSSALSGALDRVRVTTAAGSDVFDAGTINILYQ